MTTSLIMTEEFLTTTNDRSNPNRKPNTGMIHILLDEYQEDNGLPTISKLETLMIGVRVVRKVNTPILIQRPQRDGVVTT